MRIYTSLIIILANLLYFAKDVFPDTNSKNLKRDTNYSFCLGFAFNIQPDILNGMIFPIIGISKNTSLRRKTLYLSGYYENTFKKISLNYEKYFFRNNNKFFWGYHFGVGYIKYEKLKWSFSGCSGDYEKIEFFVPTFGTQLGLRCKISENRYLEISTQFFSFKLPINLITIRIM